MAYLFEQLESAIRYGAGKPVPNYISDNLNPSRPLREYQKRAFQHFITHYESDQCPKPTQVLFHMATGSGKTLIMAGLMIYLYKKGYRNFLFFVNLSNIVQKTKENFLNAKSTKYLFADEINLDGERIPIKEVGNFQYSDPNAINIVFTTVQGLHMGMWETHENSLSLDDFAEKPVVLISDEAHHLNVSTKKSKDEEKAARTWEQTVNYLFLSNVRNVLLEFTATCQTENPLIKAQYESKIIFDYTLRKFRADLYSKEILTLRTDLSPMDKALQALMLSQYRLKVFQDNRLSIKPVILLKSNRIEDSKRFMADFIETVHNLTGATLERISKEAIITPIMQKAYSYYAKKGITFDALAQELRDDFSVEHCLSVNSFADVEMMQILLNSLEDEDNPYRAIFAVDKLNEGWDVLNLFDIVRLYETRQSSGTRISGVTVSEAQLIGRGARYCPFQITPDQPQYQRKYDNDLDNELRVCEELYYHCQNDSRYIGELHKALRETGIDIDRTVQRQYKLKEEFKNDSLYTHGLVFINEREVASRKEVDGLPPFVRDKLHTETIATGGAGVDVVFDDSVNVISNLSNAQVATAHYTKTLREIASMNYAIVNKALMQYPIYKFNTLKSYFPRLTSTRMFITDARYLGNIKVDIISQYAEPPATIIYQAVRNVIGKIADYISGIEETYVGTKEFHAHRFHEVFRDKTVNYDDPHGEEAGISQNAQSVRPEWQIDLSQEDWFPYTDNYGTSEEKAFVAYFKQYVPSLRQKYSKVYLVRNEREFHLYSFVGGARFEPDYVLFLQKQNNEGMAQLQIFIEPKGDHLLGDDRWKEEFLLQMKEMAIPVKKYVDDNQYRIWGFHFFNQNHRMMPFNEDMASLLD